MGNLDESTYVHVPDWKIPLTKQGYKDAQLAGQKIKELIGDDPLFVYTSPYLRTKQVTLQIEPRCHRKAGDGQLH